MHDHEARTVIERATAHGLSPLRASASTAG